MEPGGLAKRSERAGWRFFFLGFGSNLLPTGSLDSNSFFKHSRFSAATKKREPTPVYPNRSAEEHGRRYTSSLDHFKVSFGVTIEGDV